MATEVLREIHSPVSQPLQGKVALVTGGARGIGRAIAVALARQGASLAVNYNSSIQEAETLREELRDLDTECVMVRADISRSEDAHHLVESVLESDLHRIDILVNNAGITRDRSVRKMSDSDWDDVIKTNLSGTFYCTSAVLPHMVEARFGRIINISSMNGQTSCFGQANYAASKGGVIAFTKALALEVAKYNITVNTISPGYTETDMFAKVSAEAREQIRSRIPMGRFALPEEIASAAVFLATAADYITGQQINVNGGAYM